MGEYFFIGVVFGAALVFLGQGLFKGAWGQVFISSVVVGTVIVSTRRSLNDARFNMGLESSSETESLER